MISLVTNSDMITWPIPRARAVGVNARTYDFGELTGRIDRVDAKFAWTLDCPDCEEGLDVDWLSCTTCGGSAAIASGTCPRGDTAFVRMWCRAAAAPPAADMDRTELETLADEAEGAVVIDAGKIYRRVLKLRTGFDWSVRVGRGTGRNTIRIMAAARRQVDGKMTAHDTALLAAIAGLSFVNPRGGVTVGHAKGARRSMVYTIAGVPEPCAPVLELVSHRG